MALQVLVVWERGGREGIEGRGIEGEGGDKRDQLLPYMYDALHTQFRCKFINPFLGGEGRGRRVSGQLLGNGGVLESKQRLKRAKRLRKLAKPENAPYKHSMSMYIRTYVPKEWSDKLDQLMARYDLFVEEHETAKEVVVYIRIV